MAKKVEKSFDVKVYPYAECREQHAWKPYDGVIDKRAKRAYRIQKCDNCSTKRHVILSMAAADYGEVISRSYHYPKGYQVTGGIDHRDRGLIRMHNFLADLDAQQLPTEVPEG
jgi:hypothetical protein